MADETTWAKRMPAVIQAVRIGLEDHGIPTCTVMLEGDRGRWGQGFGGLALDARTVPLFVQGVCAAFGVRDPEALVGMRCTALYARADWNAPILALEGPAGVFSIDAWRQQVHPGTPTEAQRERAALEREAARLERRLAEVRAELAKGG